MSNVEIIDTKQELMIKAEQFGVGKETQMSLAEAYHKVAEQTQLWKQEAFEIVVVSADDEKGMKQARSLRLQSKKLRGELDKKRKELKHESLQKGKAIDSIAKAFREDLEEMEAHLQEQEDFAKREKERIAAELKESRSKELDEYEFDYTFIKLGDMTEEQYANLLNTAKTAHEARIRAEQEAAEAERKRLEEEAEKERQRIAAEKAEQERIRKENERLKAEQEAREKAMEAERKKQEAALKAEQERREKELAEERAKAEAERKKLEAAEKKRKAAEAKKLKAEREAKAKAEAEAKALREAEEKRKAAETARLKAEEEARQKALEAGDKDKLSALLDHIQSIELKSDEGQACIDQIAAIITDTIETIE